MKIEIWSDLMCPFCYIGKKKFEAALEQFVDKNSVDIEWKSFQLNPELKTQIGKKLNHFLAEEKGVSFEQATEIGNQATIMAKQIGLIFQLDKTVIANTFNAHRFAHFAKINGKQNQAEELLFRSYFIDGKNIDDFPTLIELGKEIGLDTNQLKRVLEDSSYKDEVLADIYEAQQIGVRGVPFFVFNRKYAVSGAQDPYIFLETLKKSFSEYQEEKRYLKLELIEGNACKSNRNCD